MDPLAGLDQLERRYARLLGNLQGRARNAAIEAQLAALHALIRANFDPLWTSHHIEPIVPVRRYSATAVRQALKTVLLPDEPQTTRQLAKKVIESLSDTPPTDQEMRNMDRAVRAALDGDVLRGAKRARQTPAAWVSESASPD
jgi:hypothetical protein